MVATFIRLATLLALTISWSCRAEAIPKAYVAGSGESVKSWGPRGFEGLKGGFQPLAVYIYDHEPKKNVLAYHLEGKDALNSAEVKEKLAKFAKLKVKTDATDAKGWPDGFLRPADKGASLILMSSDMTLQFVFDKSKEAPQRSKDSIIAAAAAILAHEEKLKVQAAKDDKKAHPVVAEKDKEPDMFTIGLDKDKKKAEADAAKKAADAKKTGDAKTPDAKKDPKKMAQDE